MNRFLFFASLLSPFILPAPMHAATLPYYTDSTVANMATTSAQAWGGMNNTGSDTVMEVIFDYTSALHTLTHSPAASLAPTTPVVLWEAGGTGDGTAGTGEVLRVC